MSASRRTRIAFSSVSSSTLRPTAIDLGTALFAEPSEPYPVLVGGLGGASSGPPQTAEATLPTTATRPEVCTGPGSSSSCARPHRQERYCERESTRIHSASNLPA